MCGSLTILCCREKLLLPVVGPRHAAHAGCWTILKISGAGGLVHRCVWWGYSHPGVELGRMSLARHALYMRVARKLGSLKVAYTLPPYQVKLLSGIHAVASEVQVLLMSVAKNLALLWHCTTWRLLG